jgi:hypothetical protein
MVFFATKYDVLYTSVLRLILLFSLKKSVTLILATLSVYKLNNTKQNTSVKNIFLNLNNLSLKNKAKKNKIISPIYNVKLGLTKQINKKIIDEK